MTHHVTFPVIIIKFTKVLKFRLYRGWEKLRNYLNTLGVTVMKKIIALTTLLAASGSFAASTNTTTTEVKSIKDRISTWYYGEIDTDRVSNNDDEGLGQQGTDFLNYLNIGYEINSSNVFNLTLRMNATDKISGNGEGDRYEELDPRVAVKTTIFKNEKSSLKWNTMFELPASRYSNYEHGDERITRFKPSMTYSTKIDDYNSLILFGGFNKTFYKRNTASVDETSRHYLTSWISYTNSALSEKYKLKIDFEGLMRHNAGKDDLNVTASSGEERILAGVNTEIAGTDLFFYAQHDPSLVKAADKVGAGVQIFKVF